MNRPFFVVVWMEVTFCISRFQCYGILNVILKINLKWTIYIVCIYIRKITILTCLSDMCVCVVLTAKVIWVAFEKCSGISLMNRSIIYNISHNNSKNLFAKMQQVGP